MKKTVRFLSVFLVVFLSIFITENAFPQIQMPLPVHGSVYSGLPRGYWFIAPINITITGLMVAPEAGAGAQTIHVMKCHAQMPIAFGTPSTNFTTLIYISSAPNNTIAPVNITIQQGDTVVIMGTVTGNYNSYSASTLHTSTIGSYTVDLGRAGCQTSIQNGPAQDFWGNGVSVPSQLGRVFMYYQLAAPTDAGLQTFVFPADTVCEGANDVIVRLKNYGPTALQSVDIEWHVNDTVQATHQWNGNIAANDTSDVTVGSFLFKPSVNYTIKAYTSTPNNAADTINNLNDTILKTGIMVKPAPGFVPNDTAFALCPGDSVLFTGTLSGLPPWEMIISDGATNYTFQQISVPSFSTYFKPVVTTTYTINSVTDAGGCPNTTPMSILVVATTAPPAIITPVGSSAACMGDSVTLMASIGLNFIYEWLKDGIIIPGVSSYVLSVKQSGVYTVKVTSPAGCSTTSAPFSVVIHPLPAVFLGNDTNLLPGANIMLDAGAGFNSHNWSTGATSRTIMVDTTGHGMGIQTIWVEVKDNNYCSGRDTIKVNFTKNPGIEEVFSDGNVRIIPNPTDGKFELHLEGFPAGNITVQLFGPDGRLSYTKDFMLRHATEQISVDPGRVSDGLYLLKISNDQGSLVRKVVIRK